MTLHSWIISEKAIYNTITRSPCVIIIAALWNYKKIHYLIYPVIILSLFLIAASWPLSLCWKEGSLVTQLASQASDCLFFQKHIDENA